MNPGDVILLFNFLWGYLIISAIIFILLAFWTPAFPFLKAKILRKPVTLIIRKSGSAQWKIPAKIEEGWAYFKRGKLNLGYILSRTATIRVGANNLGVILEEKGGYIPPRLFGIAKKLYQGGFDNYTEAEIAYHIHQIEKENNIKIKPNTTVKIIDNETNEETEQPIIDYLTAELKDRGINKFLDPQEEIRNVIHTGKHRRIADYLSDFAIMEQFFKYSMNPSAIQDKISAERVVEREKSRLAFGGALTPEKAVAIIIIIIGVVTGWVILTQTHALSGIAHSITHTIPQPTNPPLSVK